MIGDQVMIEYGCLLSFITLIVMVLSRVIVMKRKGMQVFVFAKTHHSDLLLPPFVLIFVYHLFANVFDLPRISGNQLIDIEWIKWCGLLMCVLAVMMFVWGILSFQMSFRVGIDTKHPGSLITSGAFSFTRNPLYVAFIMELIGIFMIFPNPFFLIYMLAGFWVLRRQIIREEAFLKEYYGKEFEDYCLHVRRYL